MRIVEVNPQEQGLRRMAVQPSQRLAHHLIAWALHVIQVHFFGAGQLKVVGVSVEALVQAET